MACAQDLETHLGAVGAVNHRAVDWNTVRSSAYLIQQHFRYEYPGHVRDLHQRLMIVPPAWHGDQRLVAQKIVASAPVAEVSRRYDAFGNLITDMFLEYINRAVDFHAYIVVERDRALGPLRLPGPPDAVFSAPSLLTAPDDALHAAAASLRTEMAGSDAHALAARINQYVYAHFTYGHGSTGVKTTAAQAFALARGVCQDYAHVMIALCRLCDIPARYVSGHLLGEGGTHAWLEVLLPDPAAGGAWTAYPFDPTHGRTAAMNYLTVAVGRDYADVAPTSGTFRAPYSGHLSTKKHAGITSVEYFTESQVSVA